MPPLLEAAARTFVVLYFVLAYGCLRLASLRSLTVSSVTFGYAFASLITRSQKLTIRELATIE